MGLMGLMGPMGLMGVRGGGRPLSISSSRSSPRPGFASAAALAGQAEALVRASDVEIVSDFPGLHVLLHNTADAGEVRRVLDDLAAHGWGQEQILKMRREVLTVTAPETPGAAAPGGPPTTASALQALEEQNLIRRSQMALLQWVQRYPRAEQGRSRTLILVSDGFDFDQTFYDQLFKVDKTVRTETLTHHEAYPSRDQDMLSRTLAAQGWAVYCLATGIGWLQETAIVDTHASLTALMPQQRTLLKNVIDPLQNLAEESGGLVEVDGKKVGSDLQKLAQRVILSYQVRRSRDDVVRHVEVRSLRKGLTVVAAHWSVLGTPESINTARALTLATSDAGAGDLPVTCALQSDAEGKESLAVRVDLSSIDALRMAMHAATLRIAIAVAPEHAMPFTMTQRMEALDLASHARWELTFPMNGRKGAVAAVSVEEPSSAAWGGARCE